MNVVRQDKATKKWVIYAPARGKRPRVVHLAGAGRRDPQPPTDPACPFCPGNEGQLPGIILQMPDGTGEAWQTRVVPNKFPALVPEEDTGRFDKDIYLLMRGYGRHEVIIETPLHNQQPDRMSASRLTTVIETYHRRYVDLMHDPKNMMILIFRNHGVKAGTSLVHPHSQMIATGFVPHYIRWREEEAQRHFDEWGRCVFCDILEFEGSDRTRVVLENDSFLAFVPYAAKVPCEVWIMPKAHQASFGNLGDDAQRDLAAALQEILRRLSEKLNDPDYNYIINTAAQYKRHMPQLHWYLQIRPRLTTQAGFEIGSGISINPSLPEEDAAFLRED